MKFSGEELAAVMKLGMAMVAADGRSDKAEFEVVTKELTRFGASLVQILALAEKSKQMEFEKAIELVSHFDYERKKYVASYLAVIMIADGEIDEKEVALWQLVTMVCDLPEMDVEQAVDNMNNL